MRWAGTSAGFRSLSRENAEELHNILPDDSRPITIWLNPPFSASADRIEGARDTQIGAQHIEQALKRMLSGGRLVAIQGQGMANGKSAF